MSCLFDSLASVLSYGPAGSSRLRAMICDYLNKNPNISGLSASDAIFAAHNKSLDEYVMAMRKTSTWGGAIEIKALCDILSISVTVLVLSSRRYIEFLPMNVSKKHVHIHWNGGHYTPSTASVDLKLQNPRVPTVAQRQQTRTPISARNLSELLPKMYVDFSLTKT
jgi:hypothetical protein